jgi:hypothetical protein
VIPEPNDSGLAERTSQPFSLSDHGTLAPAWNFHAGFAVDYKAATDGGRSVIAFFSISESAGGSGGGAAVSKAMQGSKDAVCWAYVRLKRRYGSLLFFFFLLFFFYHVVMIAFAS